jgi:lipoprotein-anchoring transpeptidase ErfK/SrfK
MTSRGRSSSTGLGDSIVSRDKASPSPTVKRAHNIDALTGLGLTAAAASLGFSCLGGALTPAAAFPYADTSYRAVGPDVGVAHSRRSDVAVATLPKAKRPAGTKAAESGKPSKPAKPDAPKPAGPLILAVSIGSQHVIVYDNGTPIASAPISSGMPGRPTPMGIFSVIQKDRYHHSNLYSNAPMPYMQRITWSGVALHAGVLPGYPASHGCIRLPESFAVRLWGMTKMGARVIVTRNDVAPYEIDHPRLTALVKRPDPPPAPAPAPEARNDAPKGDAPKGQADVANEKSAAGAGKANAAGGTVAAGTGAAGTVVASSAPATSSDATTGGASGTQNLHDGAEHGVSYGTTPAARIERVVAMAREAELRPALDTGATPLVPTPPAKPAEASVHPGQLSLFVSRKESKLFVRKGFEPLFDMPITIAHKELPLGTHVFTDGRPTDGSAGVRWLAVSLGVDRAAPEPEPAKGKGRRARDEKPAPQSSEALHKAAYDALDRIELPAEALDRIAPLMAPGASLLISDQGLGGETGQETDFIVVTK